MMALQPSRGVGIWISTAPMNDWERRADAWKWLENRFWVQLEIKNPLANDLHYLYAGKRIYSLCRSSWVSPKPSHTPIESLDNSALLMRHEPPFNALWPNVFFPTLPSKAKQFICADVRAAVKVALLDGVDKFRDPSPSNRLSHITYKWIKNNCELSTKELDTFSESSEAQ